LGIDPGSDLGSTEIQKNSWFFKKNSKKKFKKLAVRDSKLSGHRTNHCSFKLYPE
jgi:hypothetical protein